MAAFVASAVGFMKVLADLLLGATNVARMGITLRTVANRF